MSPKEISEKAKRELAALTGFKSPTVVGVHRDGKDWIVTVEVVEKASIPEGFDVLGIYAVRLDPQGELLSYERERMRKRMETQ
jgi:hypothetical protein